MPLFREIGPIVMDPAVRRQVHDLTQENPVIFSKILLEQTQQTQAMCEPLPVSVCV